MRTLIFAFAVLLSSPVAADEADLKCDTGPVIKTFGETQWKVFSCNVDRHLMFVSAPNSPAGQVIFMIFSENGHWRSMRLFMSIGSSTRAASAAQSEIQSLSDEEVFALIAETKAR